MLNSTLLTLAAIDTAAGLAITGLLGTAVAVAAYRRRRPAEKFASHEHPADQHRPAEGGASRPHLAAVGRALAFLLALLWLRGALAALRIRLRLVRLARDPAVREAARHTATEIAAGLGFVLFVIAATGWCVVLGGH